MADESVPKPETPAVPSSALDIQGQGGGVDPNLDPARTVLDRAEGLDRETKHSAWDMFHQSADENDLVERMERSSLPRQVKHDLWDAKHTQLLINGARAADAAAEAAKTQRSKLTGNLPGEENDQGVDPRILAGLNPATAREHGIEAPSMGQNLEATNEALKNVAVVGGSIIAPELAADLLPAAGTTGLAARAARIVGGGAAAAAGAAGGTVVGRAITGQNPVGNEAAEEAGKNAAMYGFGQTAGGVVGEGLDAIGQALKRITAPQFDVYQKGLDLAEHLSGGELASANTVTKKVTAKLAEEEGKMHNEFEEGLKKIGEEAKNMSIPMQGSPLQEVANDILSGPENLDPDIVKTTKYLDAESERMEPLLKALAGQSKDSPAARSWDGLVALRQMVGGRIRALEGSGLASRWNLVQIRTAIDDTMREAAEAAGNPQLAENYRNLRGTYARKINLFQEGAMKALAEKSPDSVADILLGRSNQKIKNTEALRNLIGEDNMEAVEGSVFHKLLMNASDTGVTNMDRLRKSFDRLGPDLQQTLWGDNLPKIRSFMDEATKATKQGIANRKILEYLSHAPTNSLVAIKVAHDVWSGKMDAANAVKDLGLFAASLYLGTKGPEILMNHGARVANIISRAGAAASSPLTTAGVVTAGRKALEGPNEEEQPQAENELEAPTQQVWKPGDTIYQNGRPFTVTTVDANGNVTGAK